MNLIEQLEELTAKCLAEEIDPADGEEIKEVQQYKCIAKGSDLFSISGSATKEYGSFSYDSNYKGTAFTVKNGAKINFNRLINLNNLFTKLLYSTKQNRQCYVVC